MVWNDRPFQITAGMSSVFAFLPAIITLSGPKEHGSRNKYRSLSVSRRLREFFELYSGSSLSFRVDDFWPQLRRHLLAAAVEFSKWTPLCKRTQ